jgi:dTDP-4-amino-4,6-dideoxygalactose transaminase
VFVARRRAIAARYRERLRGIPCTMPPDAGPRHVYHRFVVEVGRPPDVVRAALDAHGVAARRPVYRPAHRALGLAGFPEADRLWSRALSLPCYPTLTDAEVDTVATALAEVLR